MFLPLVTYTCCSGDGVDSQSLLIRNNNDDNDNDDDNN